MQFTNKELHTIIKGLELLSKKQESLFNEDAKELINRIKKESDYI